MDKMELWEARLLCDYIPYSDINGWEQIRTLCYLYTLAHTKKGTNLKHTDVLKFAWDKKYNNENQTDVTYKKPSKKEIDALIKKAKSREKYHNK